MDVTPAGPALPGITHHYAEVNGTRLHYVAAGTSGSPVLLVHGFPETWWAFRKLIPLLAASHRVFAVDLRGFGDSGNEPGEYDSATSAEDLHLLIGQLDAGPVHLTGQDISGATVFRLAATHPQDVLSLTAIEMGLPGFGLEMLADVTHGGTWHIGVLAAPGIPEMLLAGREREFLGQFAFPAMSATPGAITDADIDEFARTYSRPGGWRGAAGLYQSMLREGPDIRALARVSRADGARARGRRRRRPLHGRHHVPGRAGRSQLRVTRRRGPLRRHGGPRRAGEGSSRLHRKRRRRLTALSTARTSRAAAPPEDAPAWFRGSAPAVQLIRFQPAGIAGQNRGRPTARPRRGRAAAACSRPSRQVGRHRGGGGTHPRIHLAAEGTGCGCQLVACPALARVCARR